MKVISRYTVLHAYREYTEHNLAHAWAGFLVECSHSSLFGSPAWFLAGNWLLTAQESLNESLSEQMFGGTQQKRGMTSKMKDMHKIAFSVIKG